MKCHCGCNQEIAIKTWYKYNGVPKYIRGHNNKYIGISLTDRFWEKVNKKSDKDCWEWVGTTFSNGYGSIRVGKRRGLAHRVSYELINGSIPEGLKVLHSCDNPKCCNPLHLFIGTQKDNMIDMKTKGRWKCSDRNGELNSHHKLSTDEIQEIREMYSTYNYTYQQLGNMFGVTKSHICGIIKYRYRKRG